MGFCSYIDINTVPSCILTLPYERIRKSLDASKDVRAQDIRISVLARDAPFLLAMLEAHLTYENRIQNL